MGPLFTGRPAAGASMTRESFGSVWRAGGDGQPLIVVFSPHPAAMAWLASSIAVSLPAAVVVASSATDPRATVAAASHAASSLGADPERLAIIGESDAAGAALLACASGAGAAHRLALISPHLPDEPDRPSEVSFDEVPPVLLQFSRDGVGAVAITALERRLRGAGVAVRAIDYARLADHWARYPRAVRGSARGLDDLVAFLRRGFAVESTFGVIPGWDLH